MDFFRKLFRNGKQIPAVHTDFKEGDVFYTEKDGKYDVFKLLKINPEYNTFHVMGFEPVSDLPEKNEVGNLKIFIHHFPLNKDGFEQPKLIANIPVSDEDLSGYFVYIKETGQVDEMAAYAQKFYQEAYRLTDQKKNKQAIEKYTQAIDLIPNFFEAIDNRSFCYMNLGKWEKAIEGFQQSLQIMPDSVLALFSIGECLLRLEDYPNARVHFEKALEVEPGNVQIKEFLERTVKLMGE